MSIEYWLGITECECRSEHPIGACLRCDLEAMNDFVKATDKLINALDELSVCKIAVTKAIEGVR